MKNHYKIVDRYKAEKLFRFLNFIIDYIISIIIVVILYSVAILIYSLATGTDYVINADKLANINTYLDRIITAILYAFVMYLTEFLTKGRSLGKLITGTMVVKEDGSLPTSEDFLKRNFSRIVPFDVLSFLGSRGWHDSWSDTKVVKRKAYLEAVERETSIEDIGQIAL
ncbi:RDD family protein [compost metagenome]